MLLGRDILTHAVFRKQFRIRIMASKANARQQADPPMVESESFSSHPGASRTALTQRGKALQEYNIIVLKKQDCRLFVTPSPSETSSCASSAEVCHASRRNGNGNT